VVGGLRSARLKSGQRQDGLDEKALTLLGEKGLVTTKTEGRTTWLKRVSS
jgi:hypothetical protein